MAATNKHQRLFQGRLQRRPVSAAMGEASAFRRPQDDHHSDLSSPSLGDRGDQEEALAALVEFRSKDVERLRQRLEYYKSQLDDAERKLRDSKSQLACLRSQSSSSAPPPWPPLIIPAVRPELVPPSSTAAKVLGKAGRPEATVASSVGPSSSPGGPGTSSSQPSETINRLKRSASSPENCRAIKTKLVQKAHVDLVSSVGRFPSPSTIRFQPGMHVFSQHKRKLRCLEINTVHDQLFVTSALDGVVNVWQLQPKGSGASLLSTTDCLSPKQRRWPEDIAWHPDGDSLFTVHTADGGDAQISILNLNSSSKNRVTFLSEKPHVKGIINSIQFMPMADVCFVTGGCDHAVVLWHEGDSKNEWKPKAVHRILHSSAVTGVAGLQQKRIVLSVGVDKRIIGFDLVANRVGFKHQIETKCLGVLPNPFDFNLFMVQSGTHGKQLRLFDIRLRQIELHSFGWKQKISESQSALINQAWSPDGLYITSGSSDPVIHIFDIRYNSHNPSQSVQAHQKRVFKAAWHQSLPFLISISSDLNVGIYKII